MSKNDAGARGSSSGIPGRREDNSKSAIKTNAKTNTAADSASQMKKSFSIKGMVSNQSFGRLSQLVMQNSLSSEPPRIKPSKDDRSNKEVRRNIDGSPFVLEDDLDEEDDVASLSQSITSEPSAFLGLLPNSRSFAAHKSTVQSVIWQSQAQVKHTVEEHEKRLAVRHEVNRQLALWVSQVEEERGSPLPNALGAGLDFFNADLSDEEMDEESKRKKKRDEKPDPKGLGATLRAHFQACVQEEAKKVVDSVRKDWERERQMEVDELSSLRIYSKTLKASLDELKVSYEKVSGRAELLERQVKTSSSQEGSRRTSGMDEPPQATPWALPPPPVSAEVNKELLELRAALEASKGEIRGLLGQLGVSEGARKTLEKSLAEATSAPSEETQEELRQLRSDLEQSREENANLVSQIESLEAELSSFTSVSQSREGMPPLPPRRVSASMMTQKSTQNSPRTSDGFNPVHLQSRVEELEEIVSKLSQELSRAKEEVAMLASSDMNVEEKLVMEREVASSLGAEAEVVLQEANKKLQEMMSVALDREVEEIELPSFPARKKKMIFDEKELQSLLEESATNMRRLLEMGGFPFSMDLNSVSHLDLDDFSPRLRALSRIKKSSAHVPPVPALKTTGKGSHMAAESAPNTYRSSENPPSPFASHHVTSPNLIPTSSSSPSLTPRQTTKESSQVLIPVAASPLLLSPRPMNKEPSATALEPRVSSPRPQTAPLHRQSFVSLSPREKERTTSQAGSSIIIQQENTTAAGRETQYSKSNAAPNGAPAAALVHVTRKGSPPPLRHGPYSGYEDRPKSPLAILGKNSALAPSRHSTLGAFGVRSITATPQKGFMIDGRSRSRSVRPHSAMPRTGEGQRRTQSPERFLLVDEDGRGQPELPPGPVSFMSRDYQQGAQGVPITTYRLNTVGPFSFPAGRLLRQVSLSPVHFLEGRTKGQLIQNLNLSQRATEKALDELQVTLSQLQRAKNVNGELAIEIQGIRQHWVAEREYNSLLQDELNKMQAILRLSEGLHEN